jgi:hypothetical protein
VAYINLIEDNSPPMLLMLVLVAPWLYLFAYLSYVMGLSPEHEVIGSPNVDYANIFFIVLTIVSVVINASLLYFLGYLLTRAYKALASGSK